MGKSGRRVSNVLLALSISLTLITGFVGQALASDFSADMVNRVGNETMQAKLYVSGEKTRMEMPESITMPNQMQAMTSAPPKSGWRSTKMNRIKAYKPETKI